MLDHVGFGVSDYERSKAFYAEALAPLSIELIKEPAERAAGFGRDGKPFFWLEATRPPATQVHVAFACESRDLIHAFHEAALAAGGTDNGPPGPRPIYRKQQAGFRVLWVDRPAAPRAQHEAAWPWREIVRRSVRKRCGEADEERSMRTAMSYPCEGFSTPD